MKNATFIKTNQYRINKLVKKFQGYIIPPSKTRLYDYLANFDTDGVEAGLKVLEKIDFFDNKRTSSLMKTLYTKLQKITSVDKMLVLPIDSASGSSSYRMIEKFRCVNKLKSAKYDSCFPSGFNISLLESLTQARNKNIIFLDDFVGSGTTFVTFYKDISSVFDDTCNYYVATIAAHKEGVELIKSATPAKVISATKIIPYTNKILHPSNRCFSNHEREILKKCCMKVGVKKDYVFGFKEMSSPVIFYEKTPNNTLPILYHSNNNWKGVFTN